MKKVIILACLAVALLIVLSQSGVLDSLMLFLLAGAIPGTGYSVPSTVMLLVIVSIIWLIILRLTAIETANHVSSRHSTKKHVERKKHTSKRRFEQT